MNVGCHVGLPNWWKERFKTIKERKVDFTNRRLLQKDQRWIGLCFFKRLK